MFEVNRKQFGCMIGASWEKFSSMLGVNHVIDSNEHQAYGSTREKLTDVLKVCCYRCTHGLVCINSISDIKFRWRQWESSLPSLCMLVSRILG